FPLHYSKKRTKFIGKVMMKKWIKGLKKADLNDVKNKSAARFHKVISTYSDSKSQDLEALMYVLEGDIQRPDGIIPTDPKRKEALKKIHVPVLTVFGSEDSLAKDKSVRAQLVPGSSYFQIEGKDHITVVADPKVHMVVKAFLDYVNKN
ncbi:MAG: hypothetical protein ACFE8G_14725, partial [Candidatus Hermodarchaeota archaeon]